MDPRDDSEPTPRAGARPWPIAGAIALTALAGVLVTTPYLARAEPGQPVPDPGTVPDSGATDLPVPSIPEPTSSPNTFTGYVELLPDVAIACRVHRGRDRFGHTRHPRVLCAEVQPRAPHRKRPLDGFWWH